MRVSGFGLRCFFLCSHFLFLRVLVCLCLFNVSGLGFLGVRVFRVSSFLGFRVLLGLGVLGLGFLVFIGFRVLWDFSRVRVFSFVGLSDLDM